jgi:hypothetical protein
MDIRFPLKAVSGQVSKQMRPFDSSHHGQELSLYIRRSMTLITLSDLGEISPKLLSFAAVFPRLLNEFDML